LKVQFLIHWQAVLLLRKGMTFHSNTTCPLASSNGAISHGAMVALALVVVLVGVLLAVVVFGLFSTAAQQALSEGTHASQFTQ
jgi:hypothetical protein